MMKGPVHGGESMSARAPASLSLAKTLRAHGFDATTALVLPCALLMLALFVYPFCYGLVLSFHPKDGSLLGNYLTFFSDAYLYSTIFTTLKLALPVTLFNVLFALPIAFRVRLMRQQKFLTALLVLPLTLGTVLVAEGMIFYFGPQGWFSRIAMALGLATHPFSLVHGYFGVFVSLVITGFPFTFLLVLSYVSGIDPALEQAAQTLGAKARARFVHILLPLLAPGLAMAFCLSFVQAFAVLPSAMLVGDPASATRVISIAAYQAAFESYDYALASAIAMVMGAVQLLVVSAVLFARAWFYRGPAGGGKG